MAKKKGSDGQIRKTTAEWAADTLNYPEGMRLMDTDTGVIRTSKGTTYALAWVPGSGEGGGTVNTVGWTNQYGMSANTSGTTAVLIQPVGTEGLIKTIAQIGHGLTLGQAVRMNGGAYVAAQGTAVGSACVGFILEVVSANQFRVLLSGHSASAPAAMFSGLTAGTAYYLSPSSAGALTATPNAFGIVLIATSTTAGYVVSNGGNRATLGLPNVYAAVITNETADPPTATVAIGQLSVAPVVTRPVDGRYVFTAAGMFTADKAIVSATLMENASGTVAWTRVSADAIRVETFDISGTHADLPFSVKIEVYP